MFNDRTWASAACMLGLLSLSGCMLGRQGPAPSARSSAASSGESEFSSSRSGAMILLRTAMLPGSDPEQCRIAVTEERETTGDGLPPAVYRMALQIEGVLTPSGESKASQTPTADLRFERVSLRMSIDGREARSMAYDSSIDRSGAGNPLADLLSHVATATCRLQLSPVGQLNRLSGLDPLWRRANLLVAPPALFTAQWMFRDAGMSETVSEALFAPMPEQPLCEGESWESDAPANIPLVARINARRRNTLTRISTTPAGHLLAEIESTGSLAVAPGLPDDDNPAIRSRLRFGSETIIQRLCPETREFFQRRTTVLEADVVMTPPSGDHPMTMTIRRSRVLESERSPGPARAARLHDRPVGGPDLPIRQYDLASSSN